MIPTQMQAYVLTGFGSYDKLELRDNVPVPTAQAHEVLIKVSACGINNTDIWTREGAYGASEEAGWQGGGFSFPRIQGADAVGHIVAVGQAVDSARIGQRVMVNPSIYAHTAQPLFDATYVGSEHDGGFAQYMAVPSSNALLINSPYSDAELATFMIAYQTAEHMLDKAQVNSQDVVLVTGASGGVGSALVQLALIRGAHVIVQVGKGKEQPLLDLGVAGVLYRDEMATPELIKAKFPGLTVTVVADIVAGSQVPALLECLAVGGRYVTAGAIAGPMVTLDWRKVYLKHLSILGATMGSAKHAQAIVQYIENGQLKPLLAKAYPLAQLVQAQKDFKEKAFFGKLVVTV